MPVNKEAKERFKQALERLAMQRGLQPDTPQWKRMVDGSLRIVCKEG